MVRVYKSNSEFINCEGKENFIKYVNAVIEKTNCKAHGEHDECFIWEIKQENTVWHVCSHHMLDISDVGIVFRVVKVVTSNEGILDEMLDIYNSIKNKKIYEPNEADT